MDTKKLFKDINLNNDKYIVVGVSAGPDSIALLHMLKNNLKENIVCAHINHNVRKESNEEEEYLKNFCKDNKIIFESIKIDKWNNKNFENEARKKRYNFYEGILKKYNSHNLFLAHHGDDLIETVLMKIIRGSNLEGYAGIKKYSFLENYKIIRPLLSYTKKDLIKYDQDNKLKYYIDKSNNDTKYTRNRYRKNILPLLKEEDINVHKKFQRYSNTLEEYYNYVEDVVKDKLNEIINNNTIDINKLLQEHPFIQKNIIFYELSYIYNNKDNIIKDKHINSILYMCSSNKPNLSIALPYNLTATKSYNNLIFCKHNNIKNNYKLELKDYQVIEDTVIEKKDYEETDGNDVCRLNSSKLKLPLYLRNKLDGDIIEVKGLNGKKKVKEIFIENKIPIQKRNNYPILVDSLDNILWIPNIKKSKYNVKKNEFCDIILTSHKEREEINEK